jgi:hypothetical protein
LPGFIEQRLAHAARRQGIDGDQNVLKRNPGKKGDQVGEGDGNGATGDGEANP